MSLSLKSQSFLPRVSLTGPTIERLRVLLRRRKTLGLALAIYSGLALIAGAALNLSLLNASAKLQRTIATQSAELATLPAIAKGIDRQRSLKGTLQQQQDALYLQLPDLTSLPIIVRSLQVLGVKAGGDTDSVDYTPAEPKANRIDTRLVVAFSGSLQACVDYLASIVASFPTAHLTQITLGPSSSGGLDKLSLHVALDLAALAQRPGDVAAWNSDGLIVRVEGPVLPAFSAPPSIWARGRDVGLALPVMVLRGIARQGTTRVALLDINGAEQLLAAGQSAQGVRVAAISAGAVQLQVGRRDVTLELAP